MAKTGTSLLSPDFKAAFENMPGSTAVLLADSPHFTILSVTKHYTETTGFSASFLEGKGVFEAFPANTTADGGAGARTLQASLETAISEKKQQELIFRYDTLEEDGNYAERHWRITNKPLMNEAGAVAFILNSSEEITATVEAERRTKQLTVIEKEYNIFRTAPFAVHIFKGPELTIELANEPTLQLWKKEKNVIGKSLLEVFPAAEETGLADELHSVIRSGEIKRAFDKPVNFYELPREEAHFYNYVFQPLYEDGKNPATGVIAFVNDVTKKVRTENLLKEGEMRFQQIANTLPIVIWTASPDGNLTYISNQWESFYGNPLSKSLGSGWVSFVHPDDVPDAAAKWERSLQTGENYETEFRVQHKSGTYRRILVRALAIRNDTGEIYEWYGSNTDIEENKRIEDNIKESEHRYRMLIEESNVATALYVGRELRIRYANDIMTGYWQRDNSVTGKTLAEAVPELQGQPFLGMLDDVFTTGIPFTGNDVSALINVNGKPQEFYFNFTYKALRDAEGNIYGIHHIAQDVTSSVQAKLALQESENNLRNTILKAPVAMCILRGENYIVDIANERMIEILGAANRDVAGKPIFDIVPEGRGQGFEAILAQVYASGESYEARDVPVTLPRNNGVESIYVSFVFEAFREAAGTITGIIVVASDTTAEVTARKKIEEIIGERTKELAEANTSLQRSNAELKQFAYIASHDLQEPLRKISVFSQMLGIHLKDMDAQSQNYLTKICSSTDRMIKLVRDVLLYSELSKEQTAFTPVSLEEIAETIKTDFELMIEQKKASLTFEDLPVIEAIPLQMSQLFGNIISNALKFSRENTDPVITVRAFALAKKDLKNYPGSIPGKAYYRIEIRDNGIGFDKEYSEQIFNIFQRLHGKSSYSGTGIGLAMCKKIAQNHNGYISASGTNKGAVFSIVLPATQ